MRQVVANTEMLAQPAMDMYSRAILDLHAIHNEIGQGVTNDEALTGSVGAFGALTRAKEQASRERAALVIVIASQRFVGESFDAFVSSRAQRDSELVTFRAEASLTQRQAYDDTVSGPKKDQAEQFRIRALLAPTVRAAPGTRLPAAPGRTPTRWFSSTSDVIENMRDVQKSIGDSILVRTKELQQAEQNSALIGGAVVTVLLLLVLAITVLMAQSLVRPLRTLRTEALSIAGRRLPETVQKLREGGENAAALEISPIGVVSDDEIGEVARAFDEVHREAVRLAGQEATLRSNVNAMFVNLSRRSQTLVERQLSLIESLEQGEQDETRLGSLFRLDHLATRMRRNSENLLVLAGQEPARRWSQPIPLIDVVRASLSEVENYERVNLQLSSGVAVVGTSVNDVVHLIAELVENAISFSPRETKVIVSSNRIDGGGVMISVSDIGIGVTPEELAQANWRLANPPVVDVSVSRRMGLFVVGRLALRHGIRVQLRQQDSGGLTAMVLLPENMLSAPPNRQGPGGPPCRRAATGPDPWPRWTGRRCWPAPPHSTPPSRPSPRSRPPSAPSTSCDSSSVQLRRGRAALLRGRPLRPGAGRHRLAGSGAAAGRRPRLAERLPGGARTVAERPDAQWRLRDLGPDVERAEHARRGADSEAWSNTSTHGATPTRGRTPRPAVATPADGRPRAARECSSDADRRRGQHRPVAGGSRLLAHGGGAGGVPADLRRGRVRLVQEGRARRARPGPARGGQGDRPGPTAAPATTEATAARPGTGILVVAGGRGLAGGSGGQRALARRGHRFRAAQAGAQGEPGARNGRARPERGLPDPRAPAGRLPGGGAQPAGELPAGSTAGPRGGQGRSRRRAAVSRFRPKR